MKIFKFGGTSCGTPERMASIVDIIDDGTEKIVVLSALSGTTNTLSLICNHLHEKEIEGATLQLEALERHYSDFVNELFGGPGPSDDFSPRAGPVAINTRWKGTSTERTEARGSIPAREAAIEDSLLLLRSHWQLIRDHFSAPLSIRAEKEILAQGELMSTAIFYRLLQHIGVDSIFLPALEFMRIDKSREPDEYFIKSMIHKELEKHPDKELFITQGYICRNAYGEIDNLERGGSDYTATLIGAAVDAEEIQIWTDIDGLHNNDPRVVSDTEPVRRLSYNEAAELAYFGAKILHPTSVLPAQAKEIPLILKNTLQPEAQGTIISRASAGEGITAIAAKDNITAIKIKSGRMLNAYGFLKKIFEVFERYETPVDMVTTSEVAVSLTIDNQKNLQRIISDLRPYGHIEVEDAQTIICLVGDGLVEAAGYAHRIFGGLVEVPVRMISYGGSRNNISLLVHSKHKVAALQGLHKAIFQWT